MITFSVGRFILITDVLVSSKDYFLRRPREFKFGFYQAVLESILRYGMLAWYGNFPVQLKSKIGHLIQSAMKVMGRSEKLPLQSIYELSLYSDKLRKFYLIRRMFCRS